MMPQERPVFFASGPLQLEGLLALPQEKLTPPRSARAPGVVLCHPHPLYGGDMDNNVIVALAEGLARRGMATLRFNFRGVGASQGGFDEGRGEREDARSAVRFLAAQPGVDAERLAIVGYSFGASVALAVAAVEELVAAVVAISVPGARVDVDALSGRPVVKLFLTGSADPISPPQALQEVLRRVPPPLAAHIAEGADHSWRGHEPWLVDKVGSFLQAYLQFPSI